MNFLLPALIFYALMICGSIGVLYFSFKKEVDPSGRLFLTAEIMMLVVLCIVIVTNLYPKSAIPPVIFTQNLLFLSSELAILFSIKSLNNKSSHKAYLNYFLLAVVYCLLIELTRFFIDEKLPFLLFPVFSFFVALAIYRACKAQINPELQQSIFLKWIAWIQIFLTLFALVRIASFFSENPISPRVTNINGVFIFIVFGVLSIFRYIAYQSLRISWVNPEDKSITPLNKNLALALRDKNELTQKLISSNRALGVSALANSLTHQLSQPITGIAIQAQVAQRDIPKTKENEASIKILEKISTETGKLSELVNNLRNLFNRGDSDLKKSNLMPLCRAIADLYAESFSNKQVSFDVTYKSDPFVNINEIQIQQVLINVLNNALEAVSQNSSKTKTISLQLTNDGSDAIITITDSGSGLAPEVHNELFELYKTTKSNGMGIGLWLSKTIIDRHNGSISINSLNGIGTTVEICLPLAH